ncbi:MAG: hypothetical protein QOF51_2640 [Chloroflexota bacterium]|jgi:hypothetical protein|nr:hypothetical protein [Chloroflexota bacterium]
MTIRWRSTLPRVIAILLATSVIGVNVALAGDDGGDMPNSTATVAPSLPASSNWAGYVATSGGLTGSLLGSGTGGVTEAHATWTIPTLTCNGTTSFSSAWVGIDGYASGTVEQIGTWHYCVYGKAFYGAFAQMYPSPAVFPHFLLHPGDVVQAAVHYQGGDSFAVSLKNVTTGASYGTTMTQRNAQRSSAEWVVENPSFNGNTHQLANFSPVLFTNAGATINGSAGVINDLRWRNAPLVMLGVSGLHLAAPVPLSLGGSSFLVTKL